MIEGYTNISTVPGQVYTPEELRQEAVQTLKSMHEAEDYVENYDLSYFSEPTAAVAEPESDEEEESSYMRRDYRTPTNYR